MKLLSKIILFKEHVWIWLWKHASFMMFVSSACLYCEYLNVTTIKKKAVSQLFARNLSRALRTFFFTSVMIHTHKTPVVYIQQYRIKEYVTLGKERYKNKFIIEMTFPNYHVSFRKKQVFLES